MSALLYHAGAAIGDLAVGECVIRRARDSHDRCPPWWNLWFRVLRDDTGGPATFGVAINPGGAPTQDRRLTWGLARVAPGRWQVTPSINVLSAGRIEFNPNGGATEPTRPTTGSAWHHTPAVVGVPEPPPWEAR